MSTRAGEMRKLMKQVGATPGWRVESGGGHYRIYPADPEHAPITVPTTPGEWRSEKNALSELFRAGWERPLNPREQRRRDRQARQHQPVGEADRTDETNQREEAAVVVTTPPQPATEDPPDTTPDTDLETDVELGAALEVVTREQMVSAPQGVQEVLLSSGAVMHGCDQCPKLLWAKSSDAVLHRRAAHPTRGDASRRPHLSRREELLLERLRERILAGDWRPGTQLPTHRQIGELYGIPSTVTIGRVIAHLTAEGLLSSVPRVGTWVLERPAVNGHEVPTAPTAHIATTPNPFDIPGSATVSTTATTSVTDDEEPAPVPAPLPPLAQAADLIRRASMLLTSVQQLISNHTDGDSRRVTDLEIELASEREKLAALETKWNTLRGLLS